MSLTDEDKQKFQDLCAQCEAKFEVRVLYDCMPGKEAMEVTLKEFTVAFVDDLLVPIVARLAVAQAIKHLGIETDKEIDECKEDDEHRTV